MALNIKNTEAEALAAEVAQMSGKTLTGAVIEGLRVLRGQLLRQRVREKRLAEAREFLEQEVWSTPSVADRDAIDDDELLGYGDSGA